MWLFHSLEKVLSSTDSGEVISEAFIAFIWCYLWQVEPRSISIPVIFQTILHSMAPTMSVNGLFNKKNCAVNQNIGCISYYAAVYFFPVWHYKEQRRRRGGGSPSPPPPPLFSAAKSWIFSLFRNSQMVQINELKTTFEPWMMKN